MSETKKYSLLNALHSQAGSVRPQSRLLRHTNWGQDSMGFHPYMDTRGLPPTLEWENSGSARSCMMHEVKHSVVNPFRDSSRNQEEVLNGLALDGLFSFYEKVEARIKDDFADYVIVKLVAAGTDADVVARLDSLRGGLSYHDITEDELEVSFEGDTSFCVYRFQEARTSFVWMQCNDFVHPLPSAFLKKGILASEVDPNHVELRTYVRLAVRSLDDITPYNHLLQ